MKRNEDRPARHARTGELYRRNGRTLILFCVFASLLVAGLITPTADAAASSLIMTAPRMQALFPSYRPDVRDYAMYGCQSRPVRLKFNRSVKLNGRSSSSHTITLKADTATLLRITDNNRTTEHTLRCLGDDFPRMNVKRLDRTLDGNLILLPNSDGVDYTTIIADSNGVPLWYRYSVGEHTPHLAKRLANGQLEIMMISRKPSALGPHLEASSDTYLLRVDLNGKVYRTVKPYENGKRIAIDNHTFHAVSNGYFFVASRITTSNTPPPALSVGLSNVDSELLARLNLCRSATRWKNIGARVIRTNAKGQVTWSYDVPTVNPNSPANPSWIGDENGVRTCYLDEHHPNWVSLDPKMNHLYISLRSSGVIVAVDVDSKRLLWNIGGSSVPGGLGILGDPLVIPQGGMHSGSMNRQGELLFFDNRTEPNDTGRAVLYSIDAETMTAKFVRAFLPPRDRCTTTGGKVYCPTRVMGNATFTSEGHVLVDWGDKGGNPNLFSIFDRNGKLLLDGRDEGNALMTYKSEYVPASLPNGRRWITVETILNATTQKSSRGF